MPGLGGLIFAYDHWVRAKANQNELVEVFRMKAFKVSSTEEGKRWLEQLAQQYGELVAIKPLKMLRGLLGYPKQSFWQYVFKMGTPMELVVTRTHLLFFDPTFQPDAKITSVGREEIRRVSVNSGDGSQLYVKTKGGFIRCKVGWSMEAKPIWGVIEEVLFGRKDVR